MKIQPLLDILRSHGEIAHWTIHMADNPCCPPLIAFRYKQPPNGMADLLQGIIRTYRGAIAWDFLATSQTWVLTPLRVREYANEHGIGDRKAARELMGLEPDFGRLANSEFCLLVEHIQRQIGRTESKLGPTLNLGTEGDDHPSDPAA